MKFLNVIALFYTYTLFHILFSKEIIFKVHKVILQECFHDFPVLSINILVYFNNRLLSQCLGYMVSGWVVEEAPGNPKSNVEK